MTYGGECYEYLVATDRHQGLTADQFHELLGGIRSWHLRKEERDAVRKAQESRRIG